MKKLLALSVLSVLALSAPAHAQLFNSGNSGLLGLGNNLLGVQTGHVSVLNGGILNGSNVLSGIGRGSSAQANHGSVVTSGRGHTVAPANSGTIVRGRGNTVVNGNSNVMGQGNVVGNQWGSNFYRGGFSGW
jgi:hypothetical protein